MIICREILDDWEIRAYLEVLVNAIVIKNWASILVKTGIEVVYMVSISIDSSQPK